MLILGHFYTRRQIHDELGGSVQSYLPTVKGEVVCACLTKDMNPDTPNTILVGNGPITKQAAEKLCSQHNPIRVFLKIKSNKWQYRGRYNVEKYSQSTDEIAKHSETSGRKSITRIIYLSPLKE